MRKFAFCSITLLIFSIFVGCASNHYATGPSWSARKNNVCKVLKDTVTLYAIFVDSKYTNPWSDFDIQSTLDSINKAAQWLEQEAAQNGKHLVVIVAWHENSSGKIPIAGKLYKKTLVPTMAYGKNPPKHLNKWADAIAKKAQNSLPKSEATSITTANRAKDRERLIAALRDQYKTESVALMYFVNHYYQTESSFTLYSGVRYPTNPIEYAIVSDKSPNTILHEFLHLFGAMDLYNYNAAFLEEYLGGALMAYPSKNMTQLQISGINAYMLGWRNEMDKCDRLLLQNLLHPVQEKKSKRRWFKKYF